MVDHDVMDKVFRDCGFHSLRNEVQIQRQGVGGLAARCILPINLVKELIIKGVPDFVAEILIVSSVGGFVEYAGRLRNDPGAVVIIGS